MASAYQTVVTGKLKLKTNAATSTKSAPSKKRKREEAVPPRVSESSSGQQAPAAAAAATATKDTRTEAEKAHARWLAKREAERIQKLAAKSHREKIEELNRHLGSLSEHQYASFCSLSLSLCAVELTLFNPCVVIFPKWDLVESSAATEQCGGRTGPCGFPVCRSFLRLF